MDAEPLGQADRAGPAALTRTTRRSAHDPGDGLHRRAATVGRVHPHVTVKVVDPETGVTVQRGQTGELCTAGYGVMLGVTTPTASCTPAMSR